MSRDCSSHVVGVDHPQTTAYVQWVLTKFGASRGYGSRQSHLFCGNRQGGDHRVFSLEDRAKIGVHNVGKQEGKNTYCNTRFFSNLRCFWQICGPGSRDDAELGVPLLSLARRFHGGVRALSSRVSNLTEVDLYY